MAIKSKIPISKLPSNTLDAEIDLITKSADNQKKEISNIKPNITYSDIFRIYRYSEVRDTNNKTILELFPDIELAIETMVASIISPNDMLNPVLSYTIKNLSFPVDIGAAITDRIKEHIRTEYDILKRLPLVLREAIYERGSYSEIIVPDQTLRDLISTTFSKVETVGVEDAVSSLLYRGHSGIKLNRSYQTKNPDKKELISVTDNFGVLLAEDAVEYYLEKKSHEYTGVSVSTEAATALNDSFYSDSEDVFSIGYKTNNTGRPIIKKIKNPIPVCSKEDPSKHYGYFVILDEVANIVNANISGFNTQTMSSSHQASTVERILNRAKKTIIDSSEKSPTLSNINDLRKYLIVDKMQEYINNSVYKHIATINVSDREDILDTILMRFLENKKTRLLFIPENLMIYYATSYRENGTGKSILEKISVLASIRAMILFTNLLALVKSSISTTKVEATLDDNEIDADASMAKIINEVIKNRQLNLPIGILKVDDLVDWAHKIGFAFDFKGGPLPDIDVSITEDKNDINVVDTDLVERIDKLIIMALGLPPEIFENIYQPEFATSIIMSNALLAKRVNIMQIPINECLTKHVQKVALVDGKLKESVVEILTSNINSIRKYMIRNSNDRIKTILESLSDKQITDWLYTNTIKNIEVHLPEPKYAETDNLGELFNNQVEDIDKVLEYIISDDALPEEVIGDMSGRLENIRAMIKMVLMQKWLMENNYMEDVSKLFTLNEDKKPMLNILDEYKSLVAGIAATAVPLAKFSKKTSENITEKMDKVNEESNEELSEEETPSEEEEKEESISEDNELVEKETKSENENLIGE